KATARRSRLTVREYEDAAPPRLVLVVEPWLPATPTTTDRDRLEALISLAAGVIVEWRQEPGARLALVIAGPKPVSLDTPAGRAGSDRLLVALAIEEGGEPPTDPAEGLGRLSRAALAAPVLVLSSRADSPIPAVIGRALDRVVVFTPVGRPERWYQLP